MREIRSIHSQILSINELPARDAFGEWLQEQARQYRLTFALAFADDGVIWGRFDGKWIWCGDSFSNSPPFRWKTLQQIRLFGKDSEVFLWRSAKEWVGRVISDGTGVLYDFFDEAFLLWGKKDVEEKDGFALMRDGGQGLRHSPPLKIAIVGKIFLRHYLAYDDDGCVKISASRLIDPIEEKTK